jgi:hypothetical protein
MQINILCASAGGSAGGVHARSPALAYVLVLVALAARPLLAASAAARDCAFTTPAGNFDLAPLGTVRIVSREAASFGWTYLFSACANVDAGKAAGHCSGVSPAVQATSGACYSLGSLAQRSVAPLAADKDGRIGVTVAIEGGDSCGGGVTRTISIDVVCADVARASKVRVIDSTTRACAYKAIVESRAGCPLACARDPATGAVCGGKLRGACLANASGAASCICLSGRTGPLCIATPAEAPEAPVSFPPELEFSTFAAALTALALVCALAVSAAKCGRQTLQRSHLLFLLALACMYVFLWAVAAFVGGGATVASPMHFWLKNRPEPNACEGRLMIGANKSGKAGFKLWVEQGMSLATLNYDPQILPAFITKGPEKPCSTGLHSSDSKVRLFLLGDSVNRMMIDDACGALGGIAQRWTTGFAYRIFASPDKSCITVDGVIAFLNIYGSAPRGPYEGGHGSNNSVDDPWADTELRVQHGLDQFIEKFGTPNFVLFRSDVRGRGFGARWRGSFFSFFEFSLCFPHSNNPPSSGTSTKHRSSPSRQLTRLRSLPSFWTTRALSFATSDPAPLSLTLAFTQRRLFAGA